jgi:Holliday junction resolvase RusA-like endonuclease
MTFQVMFMVYGEPVAKGRPKFARRGNFVHAYTPAKTKTYEEEVHYMAKVAMGASKPLEGAVEAFIHITHSVPASYSKKRREACLANKEKHLKKPDCDNTAKAVIDGMNGVVMKDDSQITSLHITKVYGEIGKVEVLVREA